MSDLLTKIKDSDPEANDLSEPLKVFAGKNLRLEANDAQGRLIVPDMDLTPEIVFSLLQSSDPFPVNFDDAWQWAGYTRKDNAKRALVDNFTDSIDFLITEGSDNHAGLSPQEKAVATKKEIIKLTMVLLMRLLCVQRTVKK